MRICLGIKDAEWFAVDQPVIMPKPNLIPLTGGYRRIPVMQIGADIYCDSALIVEEIERRIPGPSLFPAGNTGLAAALQYWTDREFFQAAVAVIFGGLGDKVDPAFVRDREALSGRPFDTAAMKAAIPHMRDQLAAHSALLDRQLADGRDFLEGAKPGLSDAAAYYNLWFVRAHFPPAAAAFAGLARVHAWLERIAAIGHGRRGTMTAAQALASARSQEPAMVSVGSHPLTGKAVVVAAADYGRDPVTGILLDATDERISVAREVDDLGSIAVHFPRLGYVLRTA